jgi:hypothetical protein
MARPGVCYRCQNMPGDQLPFEHLKVLKQALLVEDPDFNPFMCETCFYVIMSNAPEMETKNLLLRAN